MSLQQVISLSLLRNLRDAVSLEAVVRTKHEDAQFCWVLSLARTRLVHIILLLNQFFPSK